MSFDLREQSLADGQPVRLYQFSRGILRFSYNSSDRDITYNNEVFRALLGGIKDSGITQSGDAEADKFVITAPADIDVAQPWRGFPPSDEYGLVVFDMHYGEGEALVSWTGSIATINWPKLDTCTITCMSLESTMARPGLTDCYSRSCTTFLGSPDCKVDLSSFRVVASIQSIDGATVSSGAVAAFPDGWFTAGYAEWPAGSGNYDRRFIERHSGSDLVFLGGTAGMPTSGSLRVYPGCDFLFGTCQDKFENGENFRGQNKLQGTSPFDGDQVW